LNCPASSLTITVLGSKPCALTLPHSAPSVAIGTGVWADFQRRDPERVEARVPGLSIGEAPVGLLGQASDDVAASARSRKRPARRH